MLAENLSALVGPIGLILEFLVLILLLAFTILMPFLVFQIRNEISNLNDNVKQIIKQTQGPVRVIPVKPRPVKK